MKEFTKTIESVEQAISLAETRNIDRVTQLQKNVTSAASKYKEIRSKKYRLHLSSQRSQKGHEDSVGWNKKR